MLTDGSVKCWGNNGYGQLGDGSSTHSSIPVSVSGISTATSISLGSIHSCAVLTDRSIKCWGDNSDGRLGDGSTTDSATPVSVTGISTAVGVALGYSYSCAVLMSGSAKCWGTNSYGQLGDGSTTGSLAPVSVTGISTASSIALGSYHSCALLTDELAKCWGNNDSGQLGDGSQTSSSTPVSVIDTCDASGAPSNGGVGDCADSLASGSTCQPTCNSGYTVSGTSSCSAGTLTMATCAAIPAMLRALPQTEAWATAQTLWQWVNLPAHVQLWVHGVWDIILQRRHADDGNVRRESLRCFGRSLKRRRGRLHRLSGEWVNLPAHVQLWVHGVWDIILQRRHADDGNMRCYGSVDFSQRQLLERRHLRRELKRLVQHIFLERWHQACCRWQC